MTLSVCLRTRQEKNTANYNILLYDVWLFYSKLLCKFIYCDLVNCY